MDCTYILTVFSHSVTGQPDRIMEHLTVVTGMWLPRGRWQDSWQSIRYQTPTIYVTRDLLSLNGLSRQQQVFPEAWTCNTVTSPSRVSINYAEQIRISSQSLNRPPLASQANELNYTSVG